MSLSVTYHIKVYRPRKDNLTVLPDIFEGAESCVKNDDMTLSIRGEDFLYVYNAHAWDSYTMTKETE
jgi:hypothetical protein